MDIKQVKRVDLTKEQRKFVHDLLLELWDVEKPFLSHIPAQYGGLEYMLISAFNKLDDIFLGYVNGKMVGFLANQVEDHNQVDKLVVKKEYRGKGYGRCLVHAFKLIVKKPLFVIITPGNVDACKFYKSVGFDVQDKEYEAQEGTEYYQLGVLDGVLADA